jgi:MGT family glycosyltransferase
VPAEAPRTVRDLPLAKAAEPRDRPGWPGVKRFLFVVPPLVGHINPTVALATALRARGHRVAWAGVAEIVEPVVGPRATVLPCAGPLLGSRPPELRGPAALQFLWERFLCPLAREMAPGVTAAVEEFAPDVLVVDQQALAGALVAERAALPWATSATTSSELIDPLAGMPKVAAWLHELMADLRRHLGDPNADGDLRFSPYLTLAFSTEALVGPIHGRDEPIRFVGPSLGSRPQADDFPWGWLDDDRAAVLVTLGTANVDAGPRFLAACSQAMHARPDRQAVIVDPGGILGDVAQHVLVRRSVPQLRLLGHVGAVVCHGGHNTVCETLGRGLPLVVAPIRDDQPIVAKQVVDAGAGIRLRFNRATADQIGTAVDAVLSQPRYRRAAQRVEESFRAAGGAVSAAMHLEELASRPGM